LHHRLTIPCSAVQIRVDENVNTIAKLLLLSEEDLEELGVKLGDRRMILGWQMWKLQEEG
jgi:hypothetical protein